MVVGVGLMEVKAAEETELIEKLHKELELVDITILTESQTQAEAAEAAAQFLEQLIHHLVVIAEDLEDLVYL